MPEVLYIIDVFSLMFQVFHAIPEMTSPAGQPTNAVFGFSRDLQMIRTQKKPDYLICAMDAPGPAARNETFAEYKANRAEMPVDLAPQIPLIEQVIRGFHVPVMAFAGWEADDVIATVARQANEHGIATRIVTADKDVRQLIGPLVQIYNVRKNLFYDEKTLTQEWGIRPDQVVDFQSLVGDSVDNVPGIPLVGPKKAGALLQQFGTLESVLENADKVAGAKLKENLKAFADRARISRKLVELKADLPIAVDWRAARVKEPDRERLRALFGELGFRRLADEMRGDGPAVVEQPVAPKRRAAPRALPFRDEIAPAAVSPAPQVNVPFAEGGPKSRRGYQVVDTADALSALLAQLEQQKTFCIDLETTSLDPLRADIIGWAVSWQPGMGYYIPVDGPLGQRTIHAPLVAKSMKPLLERTDVEIVNQNIKYDMLVLRRAGVEMGTIGVDPMVGDYLLDAGARAHNLDALAEKYLRHRMIPISDLIGTGMRQKKLFEIDIEKAAEYAAEDAQVAFELTQLVADQLKEQGLWSLYWDLERPLIRVLADMEYAGVRVDVEELSRQSRELDARLNELIGQIHAEAGSEFNIDSPLQLRKVLFEELRLPVLKRSKTGPSTDQDVLERLAAMHPLPAKIIEHRQLSKLKGTYLDALPAMVNPATGRIHCSFNQVVAATGRLSSSEPNLQNIPIRTPEGRRVRRAFLAGEPGWKLLCADYSQIELRMLAHFSQDPALLAAFREGTDIHTAVACEIFNVDEAGVDANMRRIAKAVNFGVIYGQSPFGLAAALGISKEQAAHFIENYFVRYAGVDRYLKTILAEAATSGYARTILGRRRRIAGIRADAIHDAGPYRQRNLAERTAINTVIQGSAADLIKKAMLNISTYLQAAKSPARMILQIHDELVFDVPGALVPAIAEMVRGEMEHALDLEVPLAVDLAAGENWLDLGTV